jgi:hypothetical protein
MKNTWVKKSDSNVGNGSALESGTENSFKD